MLVRFCHLTGKFGEPRSHYRIIANIGFYTSDDACRYRANPEAGVLLHDLQDIPEIPANVCATYCAIAVVPPFY